MGTNFYRLTLKNNTGKHLGKRYALKEGTGFIFAIDITRFNFMNGVIDEYGNKYSELEFMELISKCKQWDYYNIGKEFC